MSALGSLPISWSVKTDDYSLGGAAFIPIWKLNIIETFWNYSDCSINSNAIVKKVFQRNINFKKNIYKLKLQLYYNWNCKKPNTRMQTLDIIVQSLTVSWSVNTTAKKDNIV